MSRRYRKTYYDDNEELLPVSEERQTDLKTEKGIVCNASCVCLRSKPSFTSQTLAFLCCGVEVEILEESCSEQVIGKRNSLFFKVQHEGLTGYILSDFCRKVGEKDGE